MQYLNFTLMDMLHMTQLQIDQLDFIEWNEAVNYATTMIRMRSMADMSQKPDETITWKQDPGFDHDPNFVSKVR